MWEFLQGTGWFLYPLAVCSVVGLAVILERAFALRESRLYPERVAEALDARPDAAVSDRSALERLAERVRSGRVVGDKIRSAIRLEIDRMQRGIFLLDIITSVAPLLGLMGTVAGLVTVFRQVDEQTGMPNPVLFTEGVAMALSTTLIGLAIAIPSLMAAAWFTRRIERVGNQLDAWLQQWLGNPAMQTDE